MSITMLVRCRQATDEELSLTSCYKHCISKYVKVTCVSAEIIGWLKAINPYSGSLILVDFKENYTEVYKVWFIRAKNVYKIDIISDSDEYIKHALFTLYETKIVTDEYVAQRRAAVIELIQHFNLPIRESIDNPEELIVCEDGHIYPPYEAEKCFSYDPILMECLQNIVKLLPEIEVV